MLQSAPNDSPSSNVVGDDSLVTPLLHVRAVSDVGRGRSLNEDAVLLVPLPSGGLFAVADGMGGHAAGEVASRLALEELRSAYGRSRGLPPSRLVRAVQTANAAVYGQAIGKDAGMGTTLAVVLVDGGSVLIASVGDSRVYLLRKGELRQLTRDHSWVAEQVRRGFLSEEEARSHAWRNVVSNALGAEEEVRLDLLGLMVERGDRVLVCSDGLSGTVTDDELRGMLLGQPDLSLLLPDLVKAANDRGGPDNISALVLDVLNVTTRPRYALPVISPEGPVAASRLAVSERSGTFPYLTLAVFWVTLTGMIILPEARATIACVSGVLLTIILVVNITRRRVRKRTSGAASTDGASQEVSHEAARCHP